MRNISFFITTPQFEMQRKDVTRRLGWYHLKVGELCQAVEKAQGLKKGEKMRKIGVIKIVSLRTEQLKLITQDDCRREGFPDMTPEQFVKMFCENMCCLPETEVNRIEFVRVS